MKIFKSRQKPVTTPETINLVADAQIEDSITLEQLGQVLRFFTEGHDARKAKGREEYIDLLQNVPGLDPTLAAVEDRQDEIPKSGWLVTSHIAPGYAGKINVTRFAEGSLSIGTANDNREINGEASVWYTLDGYGSHILAYENPEYFYKETEPYNRMGQSSYTGLSFSDTDISILANGGRLLSEKGNADIHGGALSSSMRWEDFSKDYLRQSAADIPVNRVVNSLEGLGEVIEALGAGMGLSQEDVLTLTLDTLLKTTDAN